MPAKEISAADLEVYYCESINNEFSEINYEIEKSSNSIILKGFHKWWGGYYFPTIVFSDRQKNCTRMFYLFSEGITLYEEAFGEKILLSEETPNALVKGNNNTAEYTVEYGTKIQFSQFFAETPFNGINNELIKVGKN